MVNRMADNGVGSILDYAVEEDLEDENDIGGNNESWDDCVDNFLYAIRAANGNSKIFGFAKIKVTALCSPVLLLKCSEILQLNPKIPMVQLFKSLSREEQKTLSDLISRLETLAKEAENLNVIMNVDAEQTYFQPAISRLTIEIMKKFNKDRVVVTNTYQCYLKETTSNLMRDLETSNELGFNFGAKLVRGAYLVQERERAMQFNYKDLIHATYDDTSKSYHETLDKALAHIQQNSKVKVMVASHNQATIQYAISQMKALNISIDSGSVFFGQLYGMCDYLTYPLGKAGYPAYKAVPFGPIEATMPYLSRRCQENQSILDGVILERNIVRKELIRRLKTICYLKH